MYIEYEPRIANIDVKYVHSPSLYSPSGEIRLAPILMQQVATCVEQSEPRRGIKYLTHHTRTQSIVETPKALFAYHTHDGSLLSLHTGQIHSDCAENNTQRRVC